MKSSHQESKSLRNIIQKRKMKMGRMSRKMNQKVKKSNKVQKNKRRRNIKGKLPQKDRFLPPNLVIFSSKWKRSQLPNQGCNKTLKKMRLKWAHRRKSQIPKIRPGETRNKSGWKSAKKKSPKLCLCCKKYKSKAATKVHLTVRKWSTGSTTTKPTAFISISTNSWRFSLSAPLCQKSAWSSNSGLPSRVK